MNNMIRLLILMMLPLTSMALVPSYINYQGRLLENGIPVGYPTPVTATMKLTIWSALSAGTKLYEETHSSVTIDDGVYSLQIGSGTPTVGFSWNPAGLFSASATRYTELTITIAPNPPQTLTPRQQLLSAPYTVQSGNAENLGNQPPGYYGTAATESYLQGQIDALSAQLISICNAGDSTEWSVNNNFCFGGTMTKCKGNNFDKEKFSGVTVRNSDCTSAKFTSVDFTGATFKGTTILADTDFSGSNLTGAAFQATTDLTNAISKTLIGAETIVWSLGVKCPDKYILNKAGETCLSHGFSQ